MVTPFDDNLNVDYDRAGLLAKRLADNGSDGIVVSGTTGESPTLTVEEKINLYKTVCKAVPEGTSVIAGTGSYDTRASIELTKEAEEAGVDGIMLVVPYYNRPTQEGLYYHFSEIASSTKLPIIIYNVPSRTSLSIDPKTVGRLSKIDNIAAIKEASNDVEKITEMKSICPDDFIFYSGNDSFILPMLSLGGHGVISVASHIAGNEIQDMISSFINNDVKKAWEMNLKLFPLFRAIFLLSNPIPVKKALNLTGFDVGGVRPPLLSSMGEKELGALRDALKILGR